AVASSYGSIVTDAANSEGKPIIVVCYTGQSAGHAVMALRLSGYADAKVLKWGMSGWHSDFDSWTGNCAQLDHANWVTDPVSENQDYDEPEFDTDAEEGSEILTERVNALLTGGFKGVLSIDVLDAPANYFINNYWAEADVDQFGHIAEAHRISPLVLENLNPAETVVTYCWTGQTSSMITAYLTVLGYDAKSLKFGSNSMIWDDLTSAEIHNWSASADYDFEIGE
ncbi:MAG: rhodanese-like domain-containing protein, partial [Candidatus Cloacimonadota bacterium]|nr:rhodanese-like domain-containing protein [Candidatus Cloacimonadota bacterium]